MSGVFLALLRVHLTCAFGATALFWLAAVSDKGGRVHRAAGRWFARLIYAAAMTGGTLAVAQLVAPSLVRPGQQTQLAIDATRQAMWLVLYLLLIIVAPVQHGLAVVSAAASPRRARSLAHAALNVAAIVGGLALVPAAVAWRQWTFLVIAPAGFAIGLRNLAYAVRPTATPIEWEREHLTSMVTAGIAIHTAFLVFATSRTLEWTLTGWRALAPWVLPALIGVPAIIWLRARRTVRSRTVRSAEL